MIRHSSRRAVHLPALLLALAACGTDPSAPVSPELQLTRELASDAGTVVAADLGLMQAAELTSAGAAGAGDGALAPQSTVAPNCPYDAATGWHTCPPVTERGITHSRAFAIYDNGQPQERFTAGTDSVRHRNTVSGTATRPDGGTAWVRRQREFTVTGFGTDSRTWTGAGTRDDSASVTENGTTRKYRFASFDTTDRVVRKRPASEHPWPMSGSMIHHVTMSRSAIRDGTTTSRTVTRHVVVTFNGTRVATIRIDDTTCSLDLETRRVYDCH